MQLGGGIRDLDTIERYLDDGITLRHHRHRRGQESRLPARRLLRVPGHIIVGLDASDGKVATDGWSKMTGHDVVDLAKKFEDYGVEAIIYTDIGRDGMLTGVNIEATVKLARELKMPVIASGGLSPRSHDIEQLCAVEDEGIIGAIAGRAIYEGTLDFKAALKARRRQLTAATAEGVPRPPSWPALTHRTHGPRQAHHSLPRRHRRPRRQGRQLRQPARRRRSGRGRARATTSRAPTSSPSSTSRASIETRGLLYDMIEAVADAGVHPADRRRRRAPVDDIRALLNAGADKVSINTAGVANPGAVRRGRRRGTARSASSWRSTPSSRAPDAWEVYTHGGRTPTGLDAVEWAREVAARGAGEILLTSMDRDGARTGFDLALTRAVVDAVDVPVIASGGVGSLAASRRRHREGRRRRGARRDDLPLRRVHDRPGEGGDGRGRHRSARRAARSCRGDANTRLRSTNCARHGLARTVKWRRRPGRRPSRRTRVAARC